MLRRGLIALSALGALLAGGPGASLPSATGAVAGAWRQVAMAANAYEVLENAAACLRVLLDHGAALVLRLSAAITGAFETMIPLYQVVIVVILLRLLGLFAKQALAHVVVKGMEERIEHLPGDKTVVPSPGLGDWAYVALPSMDYVYPEARAWFPIRTLSFRMQKDPVEAARALRRIPIASASVHDLRGILRRLRASWLFSEDRELLDYLQMRTFDLRDFVDCSGQCDEARPSAADSEDLHDGGEVR